MKHPNTTTIVLLLLTTATVAQASVRDTYPVATFDQGLRNRLGGSSRAFQRAPSTAAVYLTGQIFHGASGRSLCIDASRAETGFCGGYMHFFDPRKGPGGSIDSTPYTHVSFWVRGKQGGETFTVRLADEALTRKQDSAPVGPIEQFLPGGVNNAWQRVDVPLDITWRLDRQKLAGLSFEFHRPGRHTVYIDDISLVAIPEPPDLPPVVLKPAPKPSHPRAMWVWHTAQLVRLDARGRADFFQFCQKEGVEHLWMQLLYVFETPVNLGPPSPRHPERVETLCAIRAQNLLRRFNREAHQAGLKVYGLDGYPEFVQKEYHHCPLGIIDAVIDFNDKSDPGERFDGVHFDNEPHLLIGWASWNRRAQILQEFLDLLVQCQRRVRKRPGLQFGIDIPFWWQYADERTGQVQGNVTFNGVLKAASYHCIDLVDTIGIMNYRDLAEGPDGMVAHGTDLLAYGDTANGAKIYMGIETIADMDIDVWFAVGLARPEFEKAVQTTAKDFSYLSRLDEFRLRTFDDGSHIHVGLEVPHNLPPGDLHRVDRAMAKIALRFAASPAKVQNREESDRLRRQLQAALDRSIEWLNPTPRDVRQGTNVYSGVAATHRFHPKITFGDNPHDHLRSQTSNAELSFKRHKSYGGFAIHYYRTFRQIVDSSPAADHDHRH